MASSVPTKENPQGGGQPEVSLDEVREALEFFSKLHPLISFTTLGEDSEYAKLSTDSHFSMFGSFYFIYRELAETASCHLRILRVAEASASLPIRDSALEFWKTLPPVLLGWPKVEIPGPNGGVYLPVVVWLRKGQTKVEDKTVKLSEVDFDRLWEVSSVFTSRDYLEKVEEAAKLAA